MKRIFNGSGGRKAALILSLCLIFALAVGTTFALLKASEIRDNFYQVQQEFEWAEGMPTNALLVSGPSKTADIEQALVFGAHGPMSVTVVLR